MALLCCWAVSELGGVFRGLQYSRDWSVAQGSGPMAWSVSRRQGCGGRSQKNDLSRKLAKSGCDAVWWLWWWEPAAGLLLQLLGFGDTKWERQSGAAVGEEEGFAGCTWAQRLVGAVSEPLQPGRGAGGCGACAGRTRDGTRG